MREHALSYRPPDQPLEAAAAVATTSTSRAHIDVPVPADVQLGVPYDLILGVMDPAVALPGGGTT